MRSRGQLAPWPPESWTTSGEEDPLASRTFIPFCHMDEISDKTTREHVVAPGKCGDYLFRARNRLPSTSLTMMNIPLSCVGRQTESVRGETCTGDPRFVGPLNVASNPTTLPCFLHPISRCRLAPPEARSRFVHAEFVNPGGKCAAGGV